MYEQFGQALGDPDRLATCSEGVLVEYLGSVPRLWKIDFS